MFLIFNQSWELIYLALPFLLKVRAQFFFIFLDLNSVLEAFALLFQITGKFMAGLPSVCYTIAILLLLYSTYMRCLKFQNCRIQIQNFRIWEL